MSDGQPATQHTIAQTTFGTVTRIYILEHRAQLGARAFLLLRLRAHDKTSFLVGVASAFLHRLHLAIGKSPFNEVQMGLA
jgi:hypothetical protein